MMSKNWNPIWKPKLGETYYYDPLETGINYRSKIAIIEYKYKRLSIMIDN